jgi:hypothetical protein
MYSLILILSCLALNYWLYNGAVLVGSGWELAVMVGGIAVPIIIPITICMWLLVYGIVFCFQVYETLRGDGE